MLAHQPPGTQTRPSHGQPRGATDSFDHFSPTSPLSGRIGSGGCWATTNIQPLLSNLGGQCSARGAIPRTTQTTTTKSHPGSILEKDLGEGLQQATSHARPSGTPRDSDASRATRHHRMSCCQPLFSDASGTISHRRHTGLLRNHPRRNRHQPTLAAATRAAGAGQSAHSSLNWPVFVQG